MAKKTESEKTEAIEVLERFDPSEKAEIDGDPTFEFKVDEESVPSDLVTVWPHLSDVNTYKGRGWREVRAGEDGIELLSGLQFQKGEQIRMADHVLMVRDKGRHERVLAGERAANRKTREAFLKKANGDVFVNNPGSGPRQMARR